MNNDVLVYLNALRKCTHTLQVTQKWSDVNETSRVEINKMGGWNNQFKEKKNY